jgi:hypothetical protein
MFTLEKTRQSIQDDDVVFVCRQLPVKLWIVSQTTQGWDECSAADRAFVKVKIAKVVSARGLGKSQQCHVKLFTNF